MEDNLTPEGLKELKYLEDCQEWEDLVTRFQEMMDGYEQEYLESKKAQKEFIYETN